MRIIAGQFRGRHLTAPEDQNIRPTTDRLRESIFNVLDHRLGGLKGLMVADIFAGTGALGLEALSRGAEFVFFFEKVPKSLKILQDNIDLLTDETRAEAVKIDALDMEVDEESFDLIFMDPPYGKGLAEPVLDRLVRGKWLGPGGMIMLESEKKEVLKIPTALEEVKTITQGKKKAQFLGWK